MAMIAVLLLWACDGSLWSEPKDTGNDSEHWAPSNLTVIPFGDTELNLVWTDNSEFESGFHIERSLGAQFVELTSVGPDVTSYLDTSLVFGKRYNYRVAAYNSTDTSNYSNIVSVPACLSCTVDVDGNIYPTIQIDDQIWMAQNLSVTHYRNGDDISLNTRADDWTDVSTGAMCYFNNDTDNAERFGALYNWYAVSDARNIAPEGFRVPSDGDWQVLESALGMGFSEAAETGYRGLDQGSQLSGNASLWSSGSLRDGTTFGESAFDALPAGYRDLSTGSYIGLGNYAYFWSSTVSGAGGAWYRWLDYAHSEIGRYYDFRKAGYSVRCVRDVQ